MMFVLLSIILVFTSANPILDSEHTLDVLCRSTVSPAHLLDAASKVEIYAKECNDSIKSARLLPRSDVPSASANNALDVPDTAVEQVTVIPRKSENLSWSIARSDMIKLDAAHGDSNSALVAKTLSKRDDGIKLVYWRTFNFMMPATIAAVQMKQFLDAVAWKATHYWPTAREQSALFTVTQGQFQLTISCLGGTMPWPVLASAARRFSMLATGLFVYTFDAYYMDMATSITIALSFRLLDTRPAAPTHPIQPAPQLLRRRSLPSPQQAPALNQRTPTPKLSMTKFRRFAAIIPTALAMSRLEDFYSIIALKVETGQFAHWPETRILTVMRWDFELTISCDKMNVPWSFVQAFAIDMAAWSAREFTGFYEATVRGDGPLSGLVFVITMKLRDTPLKNIIR